MVGGRRRLLLEEEALAGHLRLLVPVGDGELLEGALDAQLVLGHHTFALLELVLWRLETKEWCKWDTFKQTVLSRYQRRR